MIHDKLKSCCVFRSLTCSGLLAVRSIGMQAVELGWILIVADVRSGHRIHIQTHAIQHIRITGGPGTRFMSGSRRMSSSSDSIQREAMKQRDIVSKAISDVIVITHKTQRGTVPQECVSATLYNDLCLSLTVIIMLDASYLPFEVNIAGHSCNAAIRQLKGLT